MKTASVERIKRLADARRLAVQRNNLKISELRQKLVDANVRADVERSRHRMKNDLLDAASDVLRAYAWGIATDDTRKMAAALQDRISRALGRDVD